MPRRCGEIFARLSAANPEPRSDLEYVNPYTLLVAVVLSAQATDKSVNIATAPLFARADNPAAMLELGEEVVRHHIRTIGLFNTKAKNVIALSRILVEEHGGAVPREREHLEVLPGVGKKTASVVLNVAFGEPTIAVDTHIFRSRTASRSRRARPPTRSRRGWRRSCPSPTASTPITG